MVRGNSAYDQDMRWLVLVLAACHAHARPVVVSSSHASPHRERVGVALRGHAWVLDGREPLGGVTVIATSPVLAHAAAVVTDEAGAYAFPALPAGRYEITVYYDDITYARNVEVRHDRTFDTLFQRIPLNTTGCVRFTKLRPL